MFMISFQGRNSDFVDFGFPKSDKDLFVFLIFLMFSSKFIKIKQPNCGF